MSNENDKPQDPVVYYNGYRPKSESPMHAYGRELAEQRKTDYSNSHASKRRASFPDPNGGAQQRPSGPGYYRSEEKTPDGFFKATLKQAVDTAVKNVVDPAIRNFLWDSATNMLGSLIWGKDSRRVIGGRTPYREISTGQVSAPKALPAARTEPRMSPEDHAWQRYEQCCAVPTLDEAQKIMIRLYKTLRLQGKVTLAQYYQYFGERYEFTDEAWGWTSLPEGSMYTMMIGNEYHVLMPKLEALDNEIRR